MIVVGASATLHVLDLVTGEAVYQIRRESPHGDVLSLALQNLADGTMLAVIGDNEGRLERWDFSSGGDIRGRVIGDVREPIWAVATDANRPEWAATLSSSRDGRDLGLWNTASAQRVLTRHFTDEALGTQRSGNAITNSALGALALISKGDHQYIVFGDDVGALKVIDHMFGEPNVETIRTFRGRSTASALATTEAEGGLSVLSGRYDGTIRLHDLASGTALGHLAPGHTGYVSSIACADLGEGITVASASGDTLQFWQGAIGMASTASALDGNASAASLKLGVGWTTTYNRPGLLSGLKYPNLRHAYRSPSFFTDAMLAHGCTGQFLLLDEELRLMDLDGTQHRYADDVDILYVCAHGEYHAGDYRVDLHAADWQPFVSGIGNSGPCVVVFDTCNLVDPLNDPNWPPAWAHGAMGPSLRLVLGFASKATVCAGSPTLRGRAFANNLVAGNSVADAWLNAVATTRFPNTDVAIAIAIGEDPIDANDILNNARMDHLPGRRNAGTPVLAKRTT